MAGTTSTLIDVATHYPSEIARELRQRIEQLDRETDSRYALEYCAPYEPADRVGERVIRPGYRWISCYPVTGGSEGHYLHVIVVYQQDAERRSLRANEYREIVMIKIFGGWDAAAELSGIVARWLDA